jgi:hypothetical protein
MVNARGVARLGILAVGLGIGAAVASSPVIASADSSTDWLSGLGDLLMIVVFGLAWTPGEALQAFPFPGGPIPFSAMSRDPQWRTQ